jgi:hypothetical protein
MATASNSPTTLTTTTTTYPALNEKWESADTNLHEEHGNEKGLDTYEEEEEISKAEEEILSIPEKHENYRLKVLRDHNGIFEVWFKDLLLNKTFQETPSAPAQHVHH